MPHYPANCAACGQSLSHGAPKPYMGHYVLELEREDSGFRVVCQLHHYYEATCDCGHISQAKPGTGYVSEVEGRSRDLKLTEYVLVGPLLATLIASLAVRYRMSRAKIQEFLRDWMGTELGIGTIDRCVREAGIASLPVVEELVEQLQEAEILHLDETPWYVKGKLQWLWVAITSNTAVFHIGSRRKEELAHKRERSLCRLVGHRWLQSLSSQEKTAAMFGSFNPESARYLRSSGRKSCSNRTVDSD